MKTVYLIIALLMVSPVRAEMPDWEDYQQVLVHVKPGQKHGVKLNLVDYQAIIENGSLERAYQTVSRFDVRQLQSREQRLAFYINAYNILALKMVADHLPLDSIKDIGNLFSPVWGKPAGSIGGKSVALGDIEHRILRPMGEPRIHLAIVCASVSCPDLRTEVYRADKLSQQLDDQASRFLHNAGKGLRLADGIIRVSKIFDWFEEDFAKTGGVAAFIHRYRPNLERWPVKANLPYDWSLNGVQ